MVLWIEQDTLLRSREDLITAVMSELGFERRGKKIVGRIGAAIDAVRRPSTTPTATTPPPPLGAPASLSRSTTPIDWHDVEVVGENYYRDALSAALRKRGASLSQDIRLNVEATLVPEAHNRHDRNAVAVHIDGVCVAHLARHQAARYQQHVIKLQHAGRQVRVNAKLYGSAGSPNVGVFLELPSPGDMRRAFNEVRF